MKKVLHVKPSSATNAIYAECGRFPLLIKQKVQVIKYWQRIQKMTNSSIVRKAYNFLLELHNHGQSNWCSHVKKILEDNNMLHVWEEQNIDNITLNTIKEHLYQ